MITHDMHGSYLAHNELNLVDLTSREWVVSVGAVSQGAVKPMIARVANASVQFVAIPDLSVKRQTTWS